MYFSWFIIFLLFFSTSDIFADDVYDKYISLMGFKLEDSNLYKIREVLGHVAIMHGGDAADTHYEICYTSKEHKTSVHFESGEMGGDEHTLLSFVISSSVDQSGNCGELAVKPEALKLGAIMLGSDINSVKQLLPHPLKIMNTEITHQHISKVYFSKEDISKTSVQDLKEAYWDVSITIEVFETRGLVSSYRVSKVTSW